MVSQLLSMVGTQIAGRKGFLGQLIDDLLRPFRMFQQRIQDGDPYGRTQLIECLQQDGDGGFGQETIGRSDDGELDRCRLTRINQGNQFCLLIRSERR